MRRIVAGAALIACGMPVAARSADSVPHQRRPAQPPADYRLHAAPPAPPPARLVDGVDPRLRTGFGESMVGFYPLPDSGFHVAAGGRLFGHPGHAGVDDPESERLLAIPRGAGGVGSRGGRRRPSPAMLMGIDRPMGQKLAVGVDGGAALGRLYSSAGRLGRLSGSDGGTQAGRVNEIGRVTMRYRF